MPGKRILVLDGHPAERSLSRLFSDTYDIAARQAAFETRSHHVSELDFDMDYGFAGYARSKPLEPPLRAIADDLAWCNHLVLFAPMWWGGYPAKLEGLFERVLLPGIAFSTREKTIIGTPKPLLTGRSARVVITSDTPGFYMAFVYRNAIQHRTRRQIMSYVGIKPTRFTWLSGATKASTETIARWTGSIADLGKAGA